MTQADEIRAEKFRQFVDWTGRHITGDEKGQAQIFLDRFFQACGHKGFLEVGGKPEFRIKKPRESGGGTSFADYVWKPIVLIEMKKRGTDLSRHLRQAFDYWTQLVPNRPEFTILCNFDELWLYDFDQDIYEPVDRLKLEELPEHFHALAFLFPTREQPVFRDNRIEVTKNAADLLAHCYGKLKARRDVGPQTAQRFILQMLIALFSEDIDLLPKHFVTQLLDECTDPPKAFDLLGGLFRAMNLPGGTHGGRYKGVPYFNGGIFSQPAPVELGSDEIEPLKKAAAYNWSRISPDIFGTMFQRSMDGKEQHKYGAHYTTPTDIMKIVGPTIVQPWRAAIGRADSLTKLRELQRRLITFTVLDPACGSGNFLYIAYRELKRIEHELLERIKDVATPRQRDQLEFGVVTSKQFFGMDIIPFAVELAKVTLTLAHKLAIDELHVDEKPLPLDNLDDNITCVDALIDWPLDGSKPQDHDAKKTREHTPWPPADVIIGNPPFLGAKRLKPERGTDYVNAVRKAFPGVPGMADYCVYWFRRAHDHLRECAPDDPLRGRAGLVGTQNIRNNKSREGGLDHIVKSGTIIEAVDNQPWSGEANVHVSIANWVKRGPQAPRLAGESYAQDAALDAQLLIPAKRRLWFKVEASSPLYDPPPESRGRKVTTVRGKRGQVRKDKSFELGFRDIDSINSALSDQIAVAGAKPLSINAGFCYTGQYPRHEGFMLSERDAAKMLSQSPRNRQVIHPYVVGREFLGGTLNDRWVIDFQLREIMEAQAFREPFHHVEQRVLPHVKSKAEKEFEKSKQRTGQDQTWLQSWWQHFRPRPELIGKIGSLRRYLVCSRVTKRPIFAFLSPAIRPGDALSCFVVDDDYSFGILQSDAHWQWFIAKCSKLKSDFRYTPESVFDTFPWPQGAKFAGPTKKQVQAVAEAGREIRRIRAEALPTIRGGLRALYRTLELPGKSALKDAHAALDAAVLDAYGFTPTSGGGDILKQLLDLNLAVAQRIERGDAVVAPGVPPTFGDPASLITDDCIRAA